MAKQRTKRRQVLLHGCSVPGNAPWEPCMVKQRTKQCQGVLRRYPTTVATLSRRARDVIEAAFEESAEAGAASPLLPSRLHDFGFRGCCTVEQSVIGGAAHLLNFTGTDTLSAAYYVQVWEQALATSEWLLEALSAVPLIPSFM